MADSATELYVSTCVLARLDQMLVHGPRDDAEHWNLNLTSGRYYLKTAERRIRRNLNQLWDNDDDSTTDLADGLLSHA